MDDVDNLLSRLAQAPLPMSLDGIEASVFDKIASATAARARQRVGAMAISGALAIGMIGAFVPAQGSGAGSQMTSLGANSPLAPSTLLNGEP